jgi:hypothetical protein
LNKLHFECLLNKWDVAKADTMPNLRVLGQGGNPKQRFLPLVSAI